jgi:SGNH domain (fused to AT3 domains)
MVTGHPGLGAVLVCLATSGVLAFGLPRLFEECLPGRVLGKIGNWSYSIYLAHFPIVVLFFYRPFAGTLLGTGNVAETVILVILIAVLSGVLYQGIEKRNRSLFTPRRAVLAAAGIVAVAIASGPMLLKAYPEDERRIFAAWTDRDVYRCGKVFRILNPFDNFCEITKVSGLKPNLMLVGDSHADSIKLSFAAVADAQGYRVFFPVPNDPLVNPHFNADWLTSEAIARRVETVFLHFLPVANLADITEQTRQKLQAAGIRTVLLMPVPVYATHIPAALYQNQTRGNALPETTLVAYHKQNAQLFSYANTIRSAMFSWYDLSPALCDPVCNLADKDGRPFYFDGGHITLTGARQLEEIFSFAIGENRISDTSKK